MTAPGLRQIRDTATRPIAEEQGRRLAASLLCERCDRWPGDCPCTRWRRNLHRAYGDVAVARELMVRSMTDAEILLRLFPDGKPAEPRSERPTFPARRGRAA